MARLVVSVRRRSPGQIRAAAQPRQRRLSSSQRRRVPGQIRAAGQRRGCFVGLVGSPWVGNSPPRLEQQRRIAAWINDPYSAASQTALRHHLKAGMAPQQIDQVRQPHMDYRVACPAGLAVCLGQFSSAKDQSRQRLVVGGFHAQAYYICCGNSTSNVIFFAAAFPLGIRIGSGLSAPDIRPWSSVCWQWRAQFRYASVSVTVTLDQVAPVTDRPLVRVIPRS